MTRTQWTSTSNTTFNLILLSKSTVPAQTISSSHAQSTRIWKAGTMIQVTPYLLKVPLPQKSRQITENIQQYPPIRQARLRVINTNRITHRHCSNLLTFTPELTLMTSLVTKLRTSRDEISSI